MPVDGVRSARAVTAGARSIAQRSVNRACGFFHPLAWVDLTFVLMWTEVRRDGDEVDER